jgi:hypothetical protein
MVEHSSKIRRISKPILYVGVFFVVTFAIYLGPYVLHNLHLDNSKFVPQFALAPEAHAATACSVVTWSQGNTVAAGSATAPGTNQFIVSAFKATCNNASGGAGATINTMTVGLTNSTGNTTGIKNIVIKSGTTSSTCVVASDVTSVAATLWNPAATSNAITLASNNALASGAATFRCFYVYMDLSSAATNNMTIKTAVSAATCTVATCGTGLTITMTNATTVTVNNSVVLGNGTNPTPAAVIGPVTGATSLDQFSFKSNTGTPSVTAVTVTLSAGGCTGTGCSTANAYLGLSKVDIQTTGGVSQCSTTTLSSNTVSISGCSIGLTTSVVNYNVLVTPIVPGSQAAALGAGYTTFSAKVTAMTATSYVLDSVDSETSGCTTGGDCTGATTTLDEQGGASVTSTSATAGNAKVTLGWTTGADAGGSTFNSTVVLRWGRTSAGNAVPNIGTTYSAGNTIVGGDGFTATVACVIATSGTVSSIVDGTGGSAGCNSTALANDDGTGYTYKYFEKDGVGNYDAGVASANVQPTAAANCSSVTGSNLLWSLSTTWQNCNSSTPHTIDNVTIITASTVIADVTTSVKTLSFANPTTGFSALTIAANTTLTVTGGTVTCGSVNASVCFLANSSANSATLDVTGNTGAAVVADSLAFAAPSGSGTDSVQTDNGHSVTVTGAITIVGNTTSTGQSQVEAFGGTVNAGSITVTGGANSTGIAYLEVTAGTITTTNGLTFNGTLANTKLEAFGGTSTINLTGTMTGLGTLALAAGTVLKTHGTSTISSAYTTLKNLEVVDGTTTLGAIINPVTNLTIDAGATLAGSTFLLTDSGNMTCNGTYSGSGGVTVSGATSTLSGTCSVTNTGAFSVTGATSANFATGAIYTLSGTLTTGASNIITNNGSLVLIKATLAMDGPSSCTSSILNAANATLLIGGTNGSVCVAGVGITASGSGNTVGYTQSSGSQACRVTSYVNLILGGTGAKTCALVSGTNQVTGNLTIGNPDLFLTNTISGVAVDSSNNKIYGVDLNGSRTYKFDSGISSTFGNNWESFGAIGTGSYQFGNVAGITYDSVHNKVFVSDNTDNRVDSFDSGTGGTVYGNNWSCFGTNCSSGTGSFSGPREIAVDPADNLLFIADGVNNRIVKMDSGTGGTTLGNNFTTDCASACTTTTGSFNAPRGIQFDATHNKLFIADSGNGRVASMDSGTGGTTFGANFTTFGSTGSGANQFSTPSQVTVEPSTNKLYIADGGNGRIVKIDSGTGGTTLGNTWTTFGTLGGGKNQFNTPRGIAIDTTNNKLFIADQVNCRYVSIDDGSGGTTFGNSWNQTGLCTQNTVAVSWATSTNFPTISGNLLIDAGNTLSVGNNFTVTGSTTINGKGTLTITAGTIAFNNDVTLNVASTWNNSGNIAISYGGSLAVNGTFTAGSSTQTFTGTTKTLSGLTSPISIPSMSVSGTLTNNATLTVSTALAGAGTLTNGATGVLNIGFATAPAITGFTASTSGNTVNYTAAAPNCKVVTYHHLNFTGSGTVTCASLANVNGNFGLSGPNYTTSGSTLTIGGTMTVGGGSTFTTGNVGLAVTGATSVAGTFTHSGNSAVTLSGGLDVSGTLSGAGTGQITVTGPLTGTGLVSLTANTLEQQLNAGSLTLGSSGSSPLLTSWAQTTTPNTSATANATTYGNGTYVVVGSVTNTDDDAMVWWTTNLSTWSSHTIGTTTNLQYAYSVIWDSVNSRWVVAGKDFSVDTTNGDTVVWYSTDLINWTRKAVASNAAKVEEPSQLIYVASSGTYVIAGDDNVNDASKDAVTWSSTDTTLTTWTRNVVSAVAATAETTSGVAYDSNNSKYAISGYSSTSCVVWSATSLSGTWTAQTLAGCNTMNGIAWGNGKYIAVGDNGSGTVGNDNGRVYYSTDATTWTPVTVLVTGSHSQTIKGAFYDTANSKFLMTGNDQNGAAFATATVWDSSDGANWTSHELTNSGGGSFGIGVAYDSVNSKYAVMGTDSALSLWTTTSTTGTWTVNNYTVDNTTAGNLTVTNNKNLTISGTITVGKATDTNTTTFDDNANNKTLDVNGAVSISSKGVFQAPPSASFTLAGDFTNDGTFTPNGGTLTLDKAGIMNIGGAANTTFHNVTDVTDASTIKFKHHTTNVPTYTFDTNGIFTVTGGASKININSDDNTNQWLVFFTTAQTSPVKITNAIIANSGCAASTANYTTDGTDVSNGNNGSCWGFGVTGITISGHIYTNEGATAYLCSTNGNIIVKASDNGGTPVQITCSADTGAFTLPALTSGTGHVITLWADTSTATKQGLVVTHSSSASGSLTLDIYQNRLVVRQEDAVAVSNDDLGKVCPAGCTLTNANIPLTYNSGTHAVVLGAGNKLYITTGKTFTPGGAFSTTAASVAANVDGDILINPTATLNMGANALSVGGDYTNSGTFSKTSGQTTTFTGTGSGYTITEGTGNLDTVIFNGSTGVWTTSGAYTQDGNLTITNGTLTMGNAAHTFSGTSSITGTLNTSGGATGTRAFTLGVTINAGGTIDLSGQNPVTTFGAGITNSSTNLANFGSGASTLTGNLAGTGSMTFGGGLTVAGAQTTSNNNTGTVTVTGTLALTGNWTQGTNSILVFGATTPTSGAGTFDKSTNANTVQYTASTTIIGGTYRNLTLGGASGTYTLPASDVTIKGNLVVTSGATVAKSAANKLIFAIGGGNTQTLTGNANNNNLGIIQVSAGTGNSTLNLGSNITVTNITIDASQILNANGSNTITFTSSGSGASRPFINNGTFTPSTSTVDYEGTSATDIETTGTSISYNNLMVGNTANSTATTFTLNGSVTVSGTLTVGSGGNTALDVLAVGANTLTLSGTGTPLTLAGAGKGDFTVASGSTVQYTGSTANVAPGTYHHLTLGGSGTYTLGTTTSQTITVNGNAIFAGNVTSASNAPALNLLGNLTINSGQTYTKGSAITFSSGTSGATFTDNTASPQDLGAVTVAVNGTATTLTLATNAKMTSLTVNSGQNLNITNKTLTFTGAGLTLAGTNTFTPTGSTVVYAATASLNGGAAYIYNNLTLGNGSVATITTPASGSNITLRGNLSIGNNATITKGASNGGTFVFAIGGGNTQNWTDANATAQDIGPVQISANTGNSILALGSSVSAFSITVDNSQTFNTGANTVTLTGTTPISGTFLPASGSTIAYVPNQGSGVVNLPASFVYSNLTLNKTSNTFRPAAGTLTVNGNLNITNGILDLATNNNTTTVYGPITNAGTLTAPGGTFTFGGNFTNNGTFNHSSGTVVASPSGGGAIQFADSFTNSVTANDTLYGSLPQEGQTFTGDGNFMHQATFTLTKIGTPGGTSIAQLYPITGSFGTTAVPAGSPLATSFAIDVSTLSTSATPVTFSFNDSYKLVNGAKYAIVVAFSGSTSSSNGIALGYNTSGGHAGNMVKFTNSWSALSANDVIFSVATQANGGSSSNSTQTINGSNPITFFNFTMTAPGKTLQFKSTATPTSPTVTIANQMNISGNSAAPVTIQSDAQGTQWSISYGNVSNGTLSYVNLRDAGCATGTNPYSGPKTTLGGGNNNGTCWGFLNSGFNSGNTTGGGTGTSGGGSGSANGVRFLRSYEATNVGTSVTISSVDATGGTVLVICAAGTHRGGAITSASATWGGVSVGAADFFQTQSTNVWQSCFHQNAPTGTQNVVVTVSPANSDNLVAYAAVFTGTDLINPLGTSATGSTAGATTLNSGSITGSLNGMFVGFYSAKGLISSLTSTGTNQGIPPQASGANPGTSGSNTEAAFLLAAPSTTGNLGLSWTTSTSALLTGIPLRAPSAGGNSEGSSGGASGAQVQSRSNPSSSGTNAIAFNSANTAHNLIVAYVVWGNTSISGVSDTNNGSYAAIGSPVSWNGGAQNAQIFYMKNIAGGANTVTATFGASTNSDLYIFEYQGLDQTSPLDQNTSGSGTGTALSSGAVTTTVDSELIFGGGMSTFAGASAGSGFTSRLTDFNGITEDLVTTGAGSNTATASTSTSGNWVMNIATFKAAGSGGGGAGGGGGGGSP